MSIKRTLGDYVDENVVKVVGGPSYSDKRKSRLKAIVIDGRPWGSYELDEAQTKEEIKHFVEIQWLGISLVGCDADLELREIRTLKPRDGKPTADFEATTRSGDTIRIELCGVVYDDEKRLFRVLNDIGEQTQILLGTSSNANLKGEYVARFVNAHLADQSSIPSASQELAKFIQTDSHMGHTSATMWPAGSGYPTLGQLDTHVAHLNADGAVRVMIEGPIAMSDPERAIKILHENYEKKQAKIGGYAEGHPVWLVFIAESKEQSLIAISMVDHLKNVDTFDPRPFDRVLLGCFTAGVTFERPNTKPRYTSLVTTG